MAGLRLLPEDSDIPQARPPATAAADLVSDDERSVAADSWSIKSEYGSTLDDEQRHADATEALSAATFRAASDYNSDKDEQDGEPVSSMLGFQSYRDATYADELANFREHGHSGEVWFGADVMEIVSSWAKSLCLEFSQAHLPTHVANGDFDPAVQREKDLSNWSVLDLGTGNGLLPQELAKQGFSDLTGTDYSEGAINLARSLADRAGFTNIRFLKARKDVMVETERNVYVVFGLALIAHVDTIVNLFGYKCVHFDIDPTQVDDVLETKLDRRFRLVMDKGTLDAIGLHPDGPIKRIMYWESVSRLVASGGLLVITSCNSTKDELIQEVEAFNQRRNGSSEEQETTGDQDASRDPPPFRYLDHVRSYPTFMFGGSVGSRVATVAFVRN